MEEQFKVIINSVRPADLHFHFEINFQVGLKMILCFGLLAVSLTNVFGGMGSWNDMSFEADAEAYDKVSAAFFLARQRFFAAMLSGKKTTLTGSTFIDPQPLAMLSYFYKSKRYYYAGRYPTD